MFKGFSSVFKGDFQGHPFRGNQWDKGPTASFAEKLNKRTMSDAHLLKVAFGGNDELAAEFDKASSSVAEKAANGEETFRKHVTNLKEHLAGKAPVYTPERLAVHQKIVDSVLAGADKFKSKEGEAPEVIFLAGRGGSGKGNFNKKEGYSSGVFSDDSHLHLDPDKVKEMMPEYDPQEAYLVHQESAYIFDSIVIAARKKGLNVVLDTTMKSSSAKVVRSFEKAGYRMSAHYMHLSPEGAAVRAVGRWENKSKYLSEGRGRLVPPSVVLKMTNNERNFDRVLHKMESWSVWANDQPRGMGPRKIMDKESHEKKVKKGFVHVLKNNPYHGPDGRFTSHANAFFVSSWGKQYADINSPNNKGKNANAAKELLKKTKGLAHALGTHVRSGGTLSDAFGSKVLSSAQLLAEGVKGYGSKSLANRTATLDQALNEQVAQAFAASGLSAKEKASAGVPLTHEEATAMAKAKEYDKKYYSKKMKEGKLKELSDLQAKVYAGDHLPKSEMAKLQTKLGKVHAKALHHGATEQELHDAKVSGVAVGAENKQKFEEAVSSALSVAAQNQHFNGGSHLADAKKKLKEAHGTTSAYINKAAEKAKADWESKIHETSQQLKEKVKSKQLTQKHIDEATAILGVAGTSKVVNDATAELKASEAIGKPVVSSPVQLTAKPSLASALGAVGGSSAKMKLPKTKEESLAVAKALGKQYYVLKLSKYPNVTGSFPAELSEAHAQYKAAYSHYASLGGNITSSNMSSMAKDDAHDEVKKQKVEADKAFVKANDHLYQSAIDANIASFHFPVGSPGYKKALAKLAEAEAEAAKHMTPKQINELKDASVHAAKVKMQETKDLAVKSVSSAASKFHTAVLAHGATSEQAVEAASVLKHTMASHDGVLTSAELAAAKTAGTVAAKANHKAMKEFSKQFGVKAMKSVESYDAEADTFFDNTDNSGFVAHSNSVVASLSRSHQNVLKSYTGADYREINRAVGAFGTAKMKGQEVAPLAPHTVNTMNKMDSAFAQTSLGFNTKLRRNMPQKYFWEQLGVSLEQLSTMKDEDFKSFVGRAYKETAYSSTSTRPSFDGCFSEEAVKTGKMALRIRAAKDMPGLHIKSISNHSQEDEVILPRGTTYVIRGVTPTGKTGQGEVRFFVDVDMIGAFPDKL